MYWYLLNIVLYYRPKKSVFTNSQAGCLHFLNTSKYSIPAFFSSSKCIYFLLEILAFLLLKMDKNFSV